MTERSGLDEQFAKLFEEASELRGLLDSPLAPDDKETLERFQRGLWSWLREASATTRVLPVPEKLAFSAGIRAASALRVLVEEADWSRLEQDDDFFRSAMLASEGVVEFIALSRGSQWEG